MKKMLKCFFVLALVFQLFSLRVEALKFNEKIIPTYDAFSKSFGEISLLFDQEDVYIKIENLNNFTGYYFKDTVNETCFIKGNRKVDIKNSQIKYGDASDKIRIIEYKNEQYISFLPTIDYFDIRIDANENGLIIYRLPYTYSQLIDEMVDVINNEKLKIPGVNVAVQGLSWVNKLIDIDFDTLNTDSRLDEVILRILKEDDSQKVTGNSVLTDLISLGVDVDSFIENVGHLDCLPEAYLARLPKSKLIQVIGTINDVREIDLDVINYSIQIGHLYKKNIDNLKNVVLNNKFSPFLLNSKTYKITQKYSDAYGDGDKQIQLVYDYFKKENINLIKENILKKCLPYSLQIGLATYSVLVGDNLNIFDYSEFLLYQKDFHNFQEKIIKEIDQYLTKISKGQILGDDEKEYFIELSRLYFQIAVAYYDYMSEEDGQHASYDGVKQIAKDKINNIDYTTIHAMLFDNPDYDSTTVTSDELVNMYYDKTFENRYDQYLKIYQAFIKDLNGIQTIQLLDLDKNGIPELLLYSNNNLGDVNCSIYRISAERKVILIDKISTEYAKFTIRNGIYFIDDFYRTSTDGQHQIYKGTDLILDVNYSKVDIYGNNNIFYEYYQGNTKIDENLYRELINDYNFQNEFIDLKQYGSIYDLSFEDQDYSTIMKDLMNQYVLKNG